MTPSININHVAGDEITFDQKGYCICDVLWATVPLKRYGVNKVLKVTLILARRRQDQPWRDCVDGNVRRELQRHHLGHRRKYVFAQDVTHVAPIVSFQAGVMQVDDLAVANLLREVAAKDKGTPGTASKSECCTVAQDSRMVALAAAASRFGRSGLSTASVALFTCLVDKAKLAAWKVKHKLIA